MPTMPPMLRRSGQPSRAEAARFDDRRRGTAKQRGYDSRWNKAAKNFRLSHPLCEYCALEGRVAATEAVDHLYPHRQYESVFWLTEWWVATCNSCHSGFKQAVERQGRAALDALAVRLGRSVMR
jgi:5-methylcytosine-specific restriction protein A